MFLASKCRKAALLLPVERAEPQARSFPRTILRIVAAARPNCPWKKSIPWVALIATLLGPAPKAAAVTGVTSVTADYIYLGDSSQDYTTNGAGTGAFPDANLYNARFNRTTNNNRIITGFSIPSDYYKYIQLADRINLERVDNATIAGKHHVILYEQEGLVPPGGGDLDIRPSYVATMEESLRSENINRGADNVFCNTNNGEGNNNNIERIDYVFSDGYPTHDNLHLRGFLVLDRGGNDQFRISAFKGIAGDGQPTNFIQSVTINIGGPAKYTSPSYDGCYGDWGYSGITMDTLVMRGYTESGVKQRPSSDVGGNVFQPLAGVFVSWSELGLATGDVIYGYTLVAADSTTDATLWNSVTNTTYFPRTTTEGASAGGLDLMSGGAMYFSTNLDCTIGNFVWDDYDGDGIQDYNEPGLSNFLVNVYDANTSWCGTVRTLSNGLFEVRGLAPGDYYVKFVYTPNSYVTNYTFSPPNVGADDTIDSDADTNIMHTADGWSTKITLGQGQYDLTWDAGLHLRPSDLAVSKTVNSNHPNIGEQIVYTITVTNKGTETVSLIQLTDTLPAGLQYVTNTTSQGTYSANDWIWNVGVLTNGGIRATMTITATIATNMAGASITNWATITRMNRPDTNTADNTASAALTVQIVDLGIRKTVDNSNPYEGSNVTYTITMTNNGPDAATRVVMLEPLTDGIAYVSHLAGTGTYDNATGIWSNFNLAVSNTATLQITVQVATNAAGNSITNISRILSRDQVDSCSSNDVASATIAVRGGDLKVTKTVDDPAPNELDIVTYTIVVENLGPADALTARLYEPLTNGITYVTNTTSHGAYSTNDHVWVFGPLAVSNSAVLTISARVNSGTVGTTITNWSRITNSFPRDFNLSNNQDDAAIYVSPLRISKQADVSFALPGSNINYTITVTNIDSRQHTGVVIADPIPAGTTYVTNTVAIALIPSLTASNFAVADNFGTVSYANNNGSANWAAAWVEGGETNGPTNLYALVTNGMGQLSLGRSLTRSANLAGATNAYFSFDYLEIPSADTRYFQDLFTNVAYTNNYGNTNWSGSWIEGGETNGATTPYAVVTNGQAQLAGSRSLTRTANLTGATNASFSFDYRELSAINTNSVLDRFTNRAYTNNYGSANWIGNWIEGGESDGAMAGAALITVAGEAQLCTNRSLTRGANILDSTNAILTFSYRQSGLAETGNVADTFGVVSYANNNGTTNWISSWIETNDDGSPSTTGNGHIYVDPSNYRLYFNSCDTGQGIERSLNLLGCTNAALNFAYRVQGLDSGEYVDVYAVSNGTAYPLARFTGSSNSPSFSTDISRYVAATTTLRFVVSGNWANNNEDFYADDVNVSFARPLFETNDIARVSISTNGTTWTSIFAITGTVSATSITTNLNITSYASTNTQIRFAVTNYEGANEFFYFDNVTITSRAPNLAASDTALVEVSSNGTTWTALMSNSGNFGGPYSTNYDLTPYISTNTSVRFRVSGYPDANDIFRFDNVTITSRAPNLASSDIALVEVSSNGTAWTTLLSNSGNFGGPYSTNYNITPYISTNTSVRFRVGGYPDANDIFRFDNPTIAFSKLVANPGQTGSPPTLASGYVLDPGQVMVVTFTAKANNPLLFDAITNTATITTDQHPVPKSASVVTPTVSIDLGLTKTVDNPTPREGSNVVYTIVVTNNGPTNATGVQVTEPLTNYISYVSYTASKGTYSTNNSIWNIGDVATGGSAWLKITANVATNTLGMNITNISRITSMSPADNNPGNNWDDAVITVFGLDLALTKSANPTNPYTGGQVVYTIAVTNKGPMDATGVQVREPLTNGVTYAGYAASKGTYTTNDSIWNIGDIAAGDSAWLEITVDVATNAAGWSITNRSTITTVNEPERPTTNNYDTAVIVPHEADLLIAKSSSATNLVNPGDYITYTIVVSNNSVDVHTGVTVLDPVPQGVSYVANSCSVRAPTPTAVTWKDDFYDRQYSLNAGSANFIAAWDESETNGPLAGNILVADDALQRPDGKTFSLQFNGAGAGSNRFISRSADMSSFSAAHLTFDYRNASLAGSSYVAVQVSSNGFATAGTEIARVTASAAATYATTNASVSPYLSTNTTFRFITTNIASGQLVWFDDVTLTATQRMFQTLAGGEPPSLATNYTLWPNEWMTITFTGRVDNPPTALIITNIASASSVQMPQPHYAMVADAVARADLGLTKTVEPLRCQNKVGTNEVVTYTIVLTNNGPHKATRVEITDYWPSAVVFSSYWASAGTYNSGSGLWSGFNLDANKSETLILTGKVNSADFYRMITNRVAVTDLNQYDPNPANDSASAIVQTLAVLSRFGARAAGDDVLVEWETSSEVGTAGFLLYRRNAAGDDVMVGEGLVPAVPGAPQGGKYAVPDRNAKPGEVLTYLLVEIEMAGGRNEYGPFTVAVEPGPADAKESVSPGGFTAEARTDEVKLARVAAGIKAAVPAAAGSKAASKPATKTVNGSPDYETHGGELVPVKLTVKSNGVYRVTADEIATLLGVSPSTVSSAFLTRRSSIENRGRSVPVIRESGGAALYFYGTDPGIIYTDANIYWLRWNIGPILWPARDGAPAPETKATTFRDTAHFEEQRYAATASFKNPEGDFWLWDYFLAGSSTLGTKSFAFRLNGPVNDGGKATLVMRLQGTTSAGRDRDHDAVVRVNGVGVGEGAWAGIAPAELRFEFDQSLLTEGSNTVEITAKLPPLVPYGIFYLDSFDISYTRGHEAVADQLVFQAGNNNPVVVSGFGNDAIRVLELLEDGSGRLVVNNDVFPSGSGYAVRFVPSGSNAQYAAFALSGARPVAAMTADSTVSDLKDGGNRADYVVVTAPDLAIPAERLATYRRSLGLSTKVVMLGDIYDEFGYGIADPNCIRSFLSYARANWNVPPKYVVLAGEGTYDYRGYKATGDNIVPPLMILTENGLFSSDSRYADLDDDGIPELAVGRLPVMNPAELDDFASKLIAYETGAAAGWQDVLALCADPPDKGGDFTASSLALLSILPRGKMVEQIHLSDVTLAAGRASLIARLNAGAGFVNFFGHSGLDSMGNNGLLKKTDVAAIAESGKPAVFTAMTCVMGRFGMPGFDCLGEALVLKKNAGAVAVWAPVGLSYNVCAETLDGELYGAIFNDGEGILGDAVLLASRRAAERGCDNGTLEAFTLLGDPATVIAGFDAVYSATTGFSIGEWRRCEFGWQDAQDPALSGDLADPDEDGLYNFVEYAFGRDPLASDSGGLLGIHGVGGAGFDYDLAIVFRRRKRAGDVEQTVSASADLRNWLEEADCVVRTLVEDDGNGLTETVKVYVATPDPQRRVGFIRLKMRIR